VSDLPLALKLKQTNTSEARLFTPASSLTTPNLQVDERNSLDDFDSCEPRLYVWWAGPFAITRSKRFSQHPLYCPDSNPTSSLPGGTLRA
jgi:hypothetical protein